MNIRWANLVVRFLLELAALVAFAYWGWTIAGSLVVRTAAAIAVPATVAMIWATFISPKARIPTGEMGRALLGLAVFLLAAGAVWSRGQRGLAMIYGALAVLSSGLLLVWPEQPGVDGPGR